MTCARSPVMRSAVELRLPARECGLLYAPVRRGGYRFLVFRFGGQRKHSCLDARPLTKTHTTPAAWSISASFPDACAACVSSLPPMHCPPTKTWKNEKQVRMSGFCNNDCQCRSMLVLADTALGCGLL